MLRRSRRFGVALVAVVALSAPALTGCGPNAGTTAAASSSPSASAVVATGSALGEVATDCPTANTKAFAKTRFVANAGLALGAFHRYLYKPYKLGKFTKGTKGRTGAIVKGALASGFIVWRLNHAKEDAKANPTLCKAIVAPVNKLIASIKGYRPGSDNLGLLDADNGLFTSFEQAATGTGAGFPDNEQGAGDLTSRN